MKSGFFIDEKQRGLWGAGRGARMHFAFCILHFANFKIKMRNSTLYSIIICRKVVSFHSILAHTAVSVGTLPRYVGALKRYHATKR